ncbi:MAG: HD domain-containing phosphohydrolase, partial [Gemmatimonadales bacterium]
LATEGSTSQVRLSEVVSALSYALDITEGQPQGHSVRSCLIGMRLAAVIRLTAEDRSALFYALLLKDLGCSSNSARLCQLFGADDLALKRAHKLTDWSDGAASARYAYTQVTPGRDALARLRHTVLLGTKEKGTGRELTATRCERGADIAALLGLEPSTQEAIQALDEHWDGRGMPYGKRGAGIPLLGRICGLAQTVEVFAATFGAEAAYDMGKDRRGSWFDPVLVDALQDFRDDRGFWGTLGATEQLDQVSDLEPAERVVLADEARLDQVAEAFARVIDAKSPYTATHSAGVARIAVGIGAAMGLDMPERTLLRRAGLLHDIGKLGVSSLILDKPGQLTEEEMVEVRKHPRYTGEILARVERFRTFAGIAASHHERLDGKGYHQGLIGRELGTLSRVLAVADVAEALSAERPYRPAMPRDEVLRIMRGMVGTGLCGSAFEALEASFAVVEAQAGPEVVGLGARC